LRVLAVDPGERYLGVAISDEAGIIARPLSTIRHTAREADAAKIVSLAVTQQADRILIGYALDSEGRPGPQARHAERLAESIRAVTGLPVILHDESFSTLTAEQAMRDSGRRRRARREHVHAAAAAAILQSYLDARSPETPPG
jgi:putative holliday junction resolvase